MVVRTPSASTSRCQHACAPRFTMISRPTTLHLAVCARQAAQKSLAPHDSARRSFGCHPLDRRARIAVPTVCSTGRTAGLFQQMLRVE
jgi:hypothetical protein